MCIRDSIYINIYIYVVSKWQVRCFAREIISHIHIIIMIISIFAEGGTVDTSSSTWSSRTHADSQFQFDNSIIQYMSIRIRYCI